LKTPSLVRAGLLAAFAAAAVAGCGPVKRINPPAASVQRLAVNEDGSLELELRIQNHSDLSTRVAGFTGQVALDGRAPLALDVPVELDVPAHAAEVVPARIQPDGWKPDASRTLRYTLTGRVTTTEPRGSYPVEYDSMLSPVPGRPGEFR
jgi:hypothetical protein